MRMNKTNKQQLATCSWYNFDIIFIINEELHIIWLDEYFS